MTVVAPVPWPSATGALHVVPSIETCTRVAARVTRRCRIGCAEAAGPTAGPPANWWRRRRCPPAAGAPVGGGPPRPSHRVHRHARRRPSSRTGFRSARRAAGSSTWNHIPGCLRRAADPPRNVNALARAGRRCGSPSPSTSGCGRQQDRQRGSSSASVHVVLRLAVARAYARHVRRRSRTQRGCRSCCARTSDVGDPLVAVRAHRHHHAGAYILPSMGPSGRAAAS